MRTKAFNFQIFLEFITYIVFSGLIFYLVKSGKYLSYVTPRTKPYLYFTAIIILIWACAGLRRLFRPQYKTRMAHCLVLVIPIIFILLPHTAISASDISSGYIGGNTLKTISGNNSNEPSSDTEETQSQSSEQNEKSDNLPGYDAKSKTITVDDQLFYLWVSEIFANMEKYEGFQITVKGYVYNDSETMASTEFAAARLLMSCCVADLVPYGIVCEYDKAQELEIGTWITVRGVIQIGQYDGMEEPQIAVTEISPAQKPDEEYIYPF